MPKQNPTFCTERYLTCVPLFRLMIANATGCSSIWGASNPSFPYTTNAKGEGPAWANSLFEDNAEFGMGMRRAYKQRRDNMMNMVDDVLQDKVIH